MTKRYDSVWDALEETPGATESMKIRSALMEALVDHITDSNMSQADAAQKFDVAELRIADLARGRIDLFSIDMCVDMLAAAGLHLDVRVREAS